MCPSNTPGVCNNAVDVMMPDGWSKSRKHCRYITVPDFDDASYQQIEAEVLMFFNTSDIVTPDEVRGNYTTLSDAVLTNSRYGSASLCWNVKCS